MHAAPFLKIAAGIALLQYLAHALLFLRAQPSHGPDEAALVDAMKRQRWVFNGFQRGYWDFYFGYGLLAILWGAVETVLLWQLAALAEAGAALSGIIVLLFAANIGHGILVLRYFFLIPAVFDALVACALVLALVMA